MHDLISKEVALGLRDGDNIISCTGLEKHRIVRAGLDSIAVHVHTSAELSTVKVCEKAALAGPDLNATLFQCEEFLLLVKENESLWRSEIRRLSRSLILAIDDFEWIAARLEHDTLIELLQEFNLSARLIKADFHKHTSCMHIYQCHWNAVLLYHV